MNLLHAKSNQILRDAIFEADIAKIRKMLTLKFGKADINAVTENGGFSMLHCAALAGNSQVTMTLIQFGADINALTEDGYSALDIAIWKGYKEVAEMLIANRCVAPIKEPETLNGKFISHNGRKATVVSFQPCNSPGRHKMRAIHYEDGENCLVDLWTGTDYQILGDNPAADSLKSLDFTPGAIPKLSKKYSELLNGDAFFDDDSDSEDETTISDIVEIDVPPGPLGVLLNSGIENRAVVQGFALLPNGTKGAIELHGGVVPGSYIIGINDINASIMSLQQVTQLLGKLSRKEKRMRFARAQQTSGSPAPAQVEAVPSQPPLQETKPIESIAPIPPPIPQQCVAPKVSETVPQTLASAPQPAPLPASPKAVVAEECIHCGLPTTVHQSDECPYR